MPFLENQNCPKDFKKDFKRIVTICLFSLSWPGLVQSVKAKHFESLKFSLLYLQSHSPVLALSIHSKTWLSVLISLAQWLQNSNFITPTGLWLDFNWTLTNWTLHVKMPSNGPYHNDIACSDCRCEPRRMMELCISLLLYPIMNALC